MTRDERIRLWSALSEVFVDNAIDHAAIARQLIIYDRTTVQAAFFEEVAPVCHSNLLAPIPPIWTGFDSAWLAALIVIPFLLLARRLNPGRGPRTYRYA